MSLDSELFRLLLSNVPGLGAQSLVGDSCRRCWLIISFSESALLLFAIVSNAEKYLPTAIAKFLSAVATR